MEIQLPQIAKQTAMVLFMMVMINEGEASTAAGHPKFDIPKVIGSRLVVTILLPTSLSSMIAASELSQM